MNILKHNEKLNAMTVHGHNEKRLSTDDPWGVFNPLEERVCKNPASTPSKSAKLKVIANFQNLREITKNY